LRWIYVPNSKEYAIPWLAAPFLSFILTIFDVPKGKAAALPMTRLTTVLYFLTIGVLAILNALLLWSNIRTQYLTWATARRPFVGTYVMLTASYLASYAVIVVLVGRAKPSIASPDMGYGLQCVTLAMLTLTAALGISGVWKSEEPGFGNLRLQRRRAQHLLDSLIAAPPSISTDEYQALIDVLAQVVATSASVKGQVSDDSDFALIRIWSAACDKLNQAIDRTTLADFNISADRFRPLAEAASNALRREKPDGHNA
jgi:hypothetical protein